MGDVVDIISSVTVGFNGLPNSSTRAQITGVKPIYGREGREYDVSAFAYEPVYADNSEQVISGNIQDINIYNDWAGLPPLAVTVTYVLDNCSSSSSSNNIPSIRLGAFPVGSVINIILANGSSLTAAGGAGGRGGSLEFDSETGQYFPFNIAGDGKAGGTVIDAEGVTLNIYFSGATPSVLFPVADGYIRAPSGGAGGFEADKLIPVGGNGGKGGDGRVVSAGGAAGSVQGEDFGTDGANGSGDDDLATFGIPGANNNALGGIAGSGVVDNSATVTFFGSDALRYINGNGDH